MENINMIKDMMGESGTTYGEDVEKMAKRLFGYRFQGIFDSSDDPHLDSGECVIINSGDGKDYHYAHWVGLVNPDLNINPEGYTYMIDSYGRKPYMINRTWKKRNWKTYLDKPIQAIVDQDCGQRTLALMINAFEGLIPY